MYVFLKNNIFRKLYFFKAFLKAFSSSSIHKLLSDETGIICCQKKSFETELVHLNSSLLLSLSIFEITITTFNHNSSKYLYISMSFSWAPNLLSTSITTSFIFLFLSSKYQLIRASSSHFRSFHSFANQYHGKSVK
jgi:hypothetical protein